MNDSIGSLQLSDWRRRVFGLYTGVRQLSVHDPAEGHELWRSGRDELFAGHPQSPLLPDDRARFTGLTVSRYDPDWRFELEVRRPDEPVRIAVDSASDGTIPFSLVGTVRIPYLGTLDVWRLTTYGGGRYLLDTMKGADLGGGAVDDAIVVDFNFAYNPSCAYDPSWSCPLAQAGTTMTGRRRTTGCRRS